ncbi:MAG: primosomal protein N' [Treponema sp.]|nr:primosomal protein N' [Treponema sp.]
MAKYLQIVLNVPLNQSFTYENLHEFQSVCVVGRRADLMFGNRRMKGYIISEFDELPENLGFDPAKIRPIKKIIDDEPVFTDEIASLAQWVSRYYLCSLGETISAMLPGGKRESEAGGIAFSDDIDATGAHDLSDEQKAAVDAIAGKSSGGSSASELFHYLYGPTGTGKTEVFLSAAERVLGNGKGVIYLVPEIALTAQVVESVTARFGKAVAVLHSSLTPSQRLSEWNRIMKGEARVVVGARSAVFAPVPNLGLVIIDEEHDGSYKSGSAPRYHARQVAMHRCLSRRIPLVMGSATPSVEAWYMMEKGQIQRHVLSRRLSGGAMPQIQAVNLSALRQDFGCISPVLRGEIEKTLDEKRQTILFLNRRGFTHFFRCNSCGFEMKCKNCSVNMTFHKNEKRLRCHYCGWNTEPPQQCPSCASLDVGYSGFGTEFIENEVRAKFPAARVVRVDTDNVRHKGELSEKIDAFKRGEYDIMLGTQMVAKGLNFKNLKLVGVILADTALHLPDFRAEERTFSLITQVAGRAGRFFPDGKVLVQTYDPNREPIACSVSGDTEKFYAGEIETRNMLDFPPFSRLVRLVFRSGSEKSAREAAAGAAEILRGLVEKYCGDETILPEMKAQALSTDILGPSECAIAKISMNYRHQILLRSSGIQFLQKLCGTLLFGYNAPNDVYIECDVDPVSLL